MNKPEFEYVKGIFDIEVPTVICITNTIRFNPIKTIAYFDGICKNGVYKFTAKIGEYKDGTEFMPDLNDKNVLIIEDIIDTGHTAKFLIDFINLSSSEGKIR